MVVILGILSEWGRCGLWGYDVILVFAFCSGCWSWVYLGVFFYLVVLGFFILGISIWASWVSRSCRLGSLYDSSSWISLWFFLSDLSLGFHLASLWFFCSDLYLIISYLPIIYLFIISLFDAVIALIISSGAIVHYYLINS